jgi:flagellar M-ring protein FliF
MDLFASTKQLLVRLGLAKLGAMAVVGASVLGLVAWVAMRSADPTGLLYSGLDPAEAGRIGQRLDELKVPYEAKGDGSVILVPAAQVARVRMELAAAGLPHQGGAGYELLDSQSPMNMTSFMQRVQRLRALEGELARTIVTLNGVRSARVHLVLPERETFARDTPKPTASVTVVMSGAARLGTTQAAAIRLLVAGAVPSLRQEDVSVLDPSGVVLAADGADALAGGRMGELKASREQALQRSVLDLLEPLVGRGKVRVVVNADIDATREVSREEKYDPLSQVERSKQTQSDQESSDESRPRENVSVGQNLPPQQAATQQNGAPQPNTDTAKTSSSTVRNGQTINYEISSSHSERVREPGEIKRLTVAVVVDGTVDDKGGFQPRPKADLDRLGELVRSAVGFDAKRGDQVTVDTLRFIPSEATGTDAAPEVAPATLPWTWIGGAAVLLLLLALVGARVVMRGSRRRIELANTGRAEALAVEAADDAAVPALAAVQQALVPLAPGQSEAVRALHDLVDARPDETLAVIRAWIAESPVG